MWHSPQERACSFACPSGDRLPATLIAMKVSDDRRKAYLNVYEDWQRKLGEMHDVLLDGTHTPVGDQFKGLLNREARAFEKFQNARLDLLGIPSADESPFGD